MARFLKMEDGNDPVTPPNLAEINYRDHSCFVSVPYLTPDRRTCINRIFAKLFIHERTHRLS